MIHLLAALVINIAPIQDIHLDTEDGKAAFTRKLETFSQDLQRSWEKVRAQETALKQKMSELESLEKGSDDWKTCAATCESLASSWQTSTQNAAPLAAKVQAGIKALSETNKTMELINAYKAGTELSDEDLAFLQWLSSICE